MTQLTKPRSAISNTEKMMGFAKDRTKFVPLKITAATAKCRTEIVQVTALVENSSSLRSLQASDQVTA